MSDHAWLKERLPRTRPQGRLVPLDPRPERAPGGGLKRYKRLDPRSARPGPTARREAQDGVQAALCRRLPCWICGRRPADPDHAVLRSQGGLDHHTWPLCRRHHDERHADLGRFMRRYNVAPEVVAAELAAALREHTCEAWIVATKGGMASVCAVCLRRIEEPTTP